MIRSVIIVMCVALAGLLTAEPAYAQDATGDAQSAHGEGVEIRISEAQVLTYSHITTDVYETLAYGLQYPINRSLVPMSPGSVDAIARSCLKAPPGNPYEIYDNKSPLNE